VEKTIDEDTQNLDQVMQEEFRKKYNESNGLYACEINGTDISCTCARNYFRNETKCRQYGAWHHGNDFTCIATHYGNDCGIFLIHDTVASCASGLSKSKAGYCSK
jgi:hypothetical protein